MAERHVLSPEWRLLFRLALETMTLNRAALTVRVAKIAFL